MTSDPADGSSAGLGRHRHYLRLLAGLWLDPRLVAKLDPSDVVQDTLLEASRDAERFRERSEAEVRSWLAKALRHRLINAARDLGRQRRDVSRERPLEVLLDESSTRLLAWLADERSSPSEVAERNELLTRLAAALPKLPDRQRQALEWRFFHGCKLREIAEQMGISEAAVAQLIERGLKRLRTELDSGS